MVRVVLRWYSAKVGMTVNFAQAASRSAPVNSSTRTGTTPSGVSMSTSGWARRL